MIDFVVLVSAVAVGVWLALVLVLVSLLGGWTLYRRRRRLRSGDSLVDLLRRRKVID